MKKHIKKIIYGLIAIFVIFFLWQRFGGKSSDQQHESIIVGKDTVVETVSDSGEVQPISYANLSFEVPSVIEWIGADVGDEVKKGQTMIRIDSDQLAAQIHSARVTVEKAISTEELARRKWEDYKPEERYNILKDVEQARAQLSATQSQWMKKELVSPIDGVVTQQDGRVGEVASGTVMRVIDPTAMHIEAFMSESDIPKMHVGQEAQITFDAFDDETFRAQITQIDPEAVKIQDVTYYRTLLTMDHMEERMRPGMSVDVDIIVAQKESVLAIPVRFVRADDAGDFVYVADGKDTYKKQYISRGLEGDNGNVEIVSGLSEGQEIFAIYDETK
ncbi:MAG: efflux RND transporter periplasmic adaptor subunit [Parcubacteria group bacterium]|jgi:multidrug efflux pump subunit AcrA (membrane-fusion protein)